MRACGRRKMRRGRRAPAKQQASVAEQANQARSRKAKEQHQNSNPRAGEKKSGSPTDGGTTKRSHTGKNKGASAKAAAAGVDRGTVEKVDQVTANDRETLQRLARHSSAATGLIRSPRTWRTCSRANALTYILQICKRSVSRVPRCNDSLAVHR